MDETQRRAPARAESGLRPEPSGNPAGRKPQAEGPWRNIARLGSPHSEPARLTVREPPTRRAARVNRHTLKKAVMAAYGGAGFGRAAVDRRATAATRKVAGTPAKGRPGNGVVSTVFNSGAVAPRSAPGCQPGGCRFDPGSHRQFSMIRWTNGHVTGLSTPGLRVRIPSGSSSPGLVSVHVAVGSPTYIHAVAERLGARLQLSRSRFDSGRRVQFRGPSDGKWHTWVVRNDSFLRSNRRPRTRYDIAQSPLLEFSR